MVSENGLHALDTATGNPRWHLPAQNNALSPPWVEAGNVHIASRNQSIFILDAGSGKKVETIAFDRSWLAPPMVSSGKLFAVDEDGLPYSVDLRSGKTVWEKPDSYAYERISGFVSTQSALIVIGVIADVYNGGISTLNMTDGAVLWQLEDHPSIAGDAEGWAICFTVTTVGAADYGSLSCYDIWTGRKLWGHDWMGRAERPVMGGKLVAVNGKAYDMDFGDERWAFANGLSSDLYTDSGIVAFSDNDGLLVAAEEQSGQELWTYELGGAMDFAVISEGILYLSSGNRCLAIDMEQ
jgi:outer membrane protein assembly factor BamB